MTARNGSSALLLTVACLTVVAATAVRAPVAQAQAAKKRRAPGVRGMFDAATDLYNSGKYAEAAGGYAAILKKYPAHEPSAIQLAKSLYRMDRIKDAYAVFAHINPQHLDPETSYEYGWAFYQNKGYEGALYAFQRVPKGHALYDLANYYGGICAIKLKKYDVAQDLLEKAVVLPDKLAKSRSLYVKHVQALLLMQQKSALAKERDKENRSLADAAAASKKKPAKDEPQDKEKAKDAPYEHQGFKSLTKSAKVKETWDHQYYDNSGYANDTFDAKVSDADFLSGFLLPLPFKNGTFEGKDRKAAVGVQLTLGLEDRITHGKEQRILADQTNADLTRQLNKDFGQTELKEGKAGAEAWVEVPLPENVWVDFGGEAQYIYLDFQRGKRTGYRRGYLDLNGKASATGSFGAEGSYMEIVDPQDRVITSVETVNATGEAELMPKLTADVKLQYDMYQYLADDGEYAKLLALGLYLDGPDAVTTGELRLSQGIPFGFKLGLLGSYQLQQNYIQHGIPTFGQVAADAQVLTGKVSLGFSPPFATWLSGSVSELVQKTQWTLQNPAAADAFNANIPNYLEEFVATVSVNLAF